MEWISVRAFGSTDESQGPLKADSLAQALSAVKSVHIDRHLPLSAFNSEFISRILAGIRRLQGKADKKKAEPLSMAQLKQITSPAPELPEILNDDDDDKWSEDPGDCTLSPKRDQRAQRRHGAQARLRRVLPHEGDHIRELRP